MNAALSLALLACAATVFADPPPPSPAQRPDPPSAVGDPAAPAEDRQPNPGSEEVFPYAVNDFDQAVAAEEKRIKSDIKRTLKALDAQYEAQKEMETRQLKEKFEFLKKMRDRRASFERGELGSWREFVKKLRETEPAERGLEKLQYDRNSMERRRKSDEEAVALNKEFMERQQRERDQYWVQVQKENSEDERRQQERATEWGKASKAP